MSHGSGDSHDSGPLATPDPTSPEVTTSAGYLAYGYVPTQALGVLGCLFHTIIVLGNLSYSYRHKGTRVFQLLLAAGGIMEVVGYAFRIKSNYVPQDIGYYIAQYVLIVCAPLFFCTALYGGLGLAVRRTICSVTLLPIPPTIFVIAFAVGETITTVLQVTGASLVGIADHEIAENRKPRITKATASRILLSGLAVQTFLFATFLVLLGRVFANSKSIHQKPGLGRRVRRGKISLSFLAVLAASSTLVFLRTVYRLTESAQDVSSSNSRRHSEALFATLEFLPILLALLLWIFFPLGSLVPDEFAIERELEKEENALRQAEAEMGQAASPSASNLPTTNNSSEALNSEKSEKKQD